VTASLSEQERRDWLRLTRTPHVGPVTFHALLARYETAADALEALPDLARKGGRVNAMDIPSPEAIDRELKTLAREGGRLIASCEPDFPARLRALDPPPPMIAVLGDPALLQRDSVAIVGARNASASGLRLAGDFARGLGEAGLAVVSGMARGIDSAAHKGALETGTVAVLAGGVDHVYPPEAGDLYDAIRGAGAIVSEQPLGYRATARDFPKRNRIVSGLSQGVIVIEAAARSGSQITARLAGEQGREVMAAPGSPLDPRSEGSNRLIRQGAALVTSVDDVLEVLRTLPTQGLFEPPASYLPDGEDTDDPDLIEQVYSLVGADGVHRDLHSFPTRALPISGPPRWGR